MPLLLVRNEETGPTVFAKTVEGLGSVRIVWGPKGTAEEVQRVSDKLLEDADFLTSMDRGTLVVEDTGDPEVAAKLAAFQASARDARERAEQRTAASIDRRQQRDLVGETCVGPNRSAGREALCGTAVIRSAKEMDETPPLCPRHQGLINEFVLVEAGSKGDERDPLRKVWKRVQTGR
jgi:hypothetical protein